MTPPNPQWNKPIHEPQWQDGVVSPKITPELAHKIVRNGNLVDHLTLRGIGFANQFHFFEELFKANTYPPKYPPYNIRAINQDYYIIEIALAGFSKESLSITLKDNVLTVKGEGINTTLSESEFDYVHQGIARRDFKHNFPLAEHIEVKTATFEDGMLNIELIRNTPEELKTKTIKIK